MKNDKQILQTIEYVKNKLAGESTGHDWWHAYRVWKISLAISEEEGGDPIVTQLGALLHDIADFKFHNGDETIGPKVAREWLESIKVSEKVISEVLHIIENISFKGAQVENKIQSLEGKIVQDADRIDALGVIGIARCFAYGGKMGHEIYNPDIEPVLHESANLYKANNSSSINHFYEKLLLLKDKLNTKTGIKIAERRHQYLENFIGQFLLEWQGKVD